MKSILSTKKLSKPQKQLFLNSGLSLVEHNAITIEVTYFKLPSEKIKNAIFTSKNSVNAVSGKVQIENCFCVGEKTADLANENGFHIQEIADYGKDLAGIIVQNYSEESFIFFCGNKRRDDIPEILKKNKIEFTEIEVYKTLLNPRSFSQEFDGILFFSPSAVQSFTDKNRLKDSTAFCIGKTTAAEAKKYTNNIITATQPSIENVIVQVVKYFKK
ncbi:uroporphyrinogen-III synthase [Salegentibacter salinarum]|uniref:Uroporphyrinogen-III synthase n=1 Tax=Salegentibacter salinarum TaxID=447422 RepID=A0A2N0U449_9FLAO|nr:uroporphyrinogen-III synthase [Salegentibacter salinarum]PKD21745.1 uroporphyrinogen-III synthase [Salegentibacter salinarum]SKB34240.1 uroporphyrinogen-III synthase [Salegentibacter salinarum]